MSQRVPCDVSVVVPFRDDEDLIGTAVIRLATHLEDQGLTFEILAMDADSGDNSHAVLALVRNETPVLRTGMHILKAPGRSRSYAFGARQARGRVLWMIEPQPALATLAPFHRAYQQVQSDAAEAVTPDLVVIEGRFALARRDPLLAAIAKVRGFGAKFQSLLVNQAARYGVAVEHHPLPSRSRALWSRLAAALPFASNF